MGQEVSVPKGRSAGKTSRASARGSKSKPLPEPVTLPAPSDRDRKSPKRQARKKRVTLVAWAKQETTKQAPSNASETRMQLPTKEQLARMRKLQVQSEKSLRPAQLAVETKQLHKQVAKKLAQLDDKRGFEHVKPRKRLPSYALGRVVASPTATGGYEGSDTEEEDDILSLSSCLSSGHSSARATATGSADESIALW